MRTAFLFQLFLLPFPYLSGQRLPVPQVKGAPFSADEVDVERPAPNVRNVVPTKTISVYRDSAGRTRINVSVPPDPADNPNIVIDDPVANVTYMIDAKNKFARRLTFPPPTPRQIPSVGDAPMNRGKIQAFVSPQFRNVQTTSESLGSQLIQGFAAEGTRITSESPQSIQGCDRNVSVNESWYSRDIWMTLVEKRSNCFSEGETHLENIQRAEPDPSLFRVPEDYTLVEQEWNKPPAKPPSSAN